MQIAARSLPPVYAMRGTAHRGKTISNKHKVGDVDYCAANLTFYAVSVAVASVVFSEFNLSAGDSARYSASGKALLSSP